MAIDKGAFPPDVLEHYRQNALIPGALTAMINYYRANLGILDEKGTPIDVPTLMLWGEEDTALDVKLTEGYGPHVRDFTLRRFPGVSHWVQQEAPGPVNAAMLAWLRLKGLVAV
jgi:pimeloyl-ACP methyl ester carboxylesterase